MGWILHDRCVPYTTCMAMWAMKSSMMEDAEVADEPEMLTADEAFNIAVEAHREGLQKALDACVGKIYDMIHAVAEDGGMETDIRYWGILAGMDDRWRTGFDGVSLAGAIIGTFRDKGFIVRARSGEVLSRKAGREVCVESPHERLIISWRGEPGQ